MALTSAYAVPAGLNVGGFGPPTSFCVNWSGLAGDGVAPWVPIGGDFMYDTTQTPAVNLAAFKASVAFIAANNGFTVDLSNVIVFTAVN